MKKIIFLDIDGTLVLPSGEVSTRVKDAIFQVRKNGHYVFLCTGRNRGSIDNLMALGFDGAICSAGGYIEINNQKIYESFLSEADIREAREAFEKNHILYNMEATYITFSDDRMNEMFVKGSLDKGCMNSEMQRMINEQKNKFNMHDPKEYDNHPIPIHKICFIAEDRESLERVRKQLSYKYNFIVHDLFSTDTINGEIIIKGTNKGNAVQKVIEVLNIPIENTICFGDSMNGYEMIQTCRYGVVMENGTEELKKYATSICESVLEDGVALEMKRLGLF